MEGMYSQSKFWAHDMALAKGLGRRVSGRWLERWRLSTCYKVAKRYPRRYIGRKIAQKVLLKGASTKEFGDQKKAKNLGVKIRHKGRALLTIHSAWEMARPT